MKANTQPPVITHPEIPMHIHPEIPMHTQPEMPVKTDPHPQTPLIPHHEIPMHIHPEIQLLPPPEMAEQTAEPAPLLGSKTPERIDIETRRDALIQSQRETVWFGSEKGFFLVMNGGDIITHKGYLKGLEYDFLSLGLKLKEARACVQALERELKSTRLVQNHGPVAGFHAGDVLASSGKRWLVTGKPNLPKWVKGEFPLIQRFCETLVPNPDARLAHFAWEKTQLKAIISKTHSKSPMLVLAGGKSNGKTLQMEISTKLRGGRSVNPLHTWTGSAPVWSDHILGAECLNIDDSAVAKDYASRERLASNFKEAIFANDITTHQRNNSSFVINPRPVWGVMMCVNDNERAIRVLPALDDTGMDDKLILIHTHQADVYKREQGDEAQKERWAAYEKEIPAFGHWLLNEFTIPDELPPSLTRTRSGALIYRDPSVLALLFRAAPAGQLEELLYELRDCLNQTPPNAGVVLENRSFGKEPAKAADWIREINERLECLSRRDSRLPQSNHQMGIYMGEIAKRRDSIIERCGLDRTGSVLWKFRDTDMGAADQNTPA